MALRFPKDNQKDYKGRITFRSFAPPVPEVNIEAVGKFVGPTIKNFQEKSFDPLKVDVGDAANYSYGTQSNKRNYSGQRVSLYLPQALTFRDAAEYSSGIEPVYLRDVNTTYNPGSMGWHSDGKASEVDITLAFIEERTLNKQDILEGF